MAGKFVMLSCQKYLVMLPLLGLDNVLMSPQEKKQFCCHKHCWKMSQHLVKKHRDSLLATWLENTPTSCQEYFFPPTWLENVKYSNKYLVLLPQTKVGRKFCSSTERNQKLLQLNTSLTNCLIFCT